MVFALYEAYQARKVSLQFAESSYIAVAIAAILLVSFIGIPVMVIARDQPRATFFVLSSLIFVICTSLLLFIFIPKEKFRRAGNSMKDAVRSSVGVNSSSYMSSSITSTTTKRFSSQDRTSSNVSESSEAADDGGLRILNDPKTVKELEEKVVTLKREVHNLKGGVGNEKELEEENAKLTKRNEELVALLKTKGPDDENTEGLNSDQSKGENEEEELCPDIEEGVLAATSE